MEALRILSTRARITATSFTNHYKWGDFKGDPNRLIGRSRLDPFRRGCDLAEVVELGEYLVLDGYSARKFGSVAISMLLVAYARQMPANGGSCGDRGCGAQGALLRLRSAALRRLLCAGLRGAAIVPVIPATPVIDRAPGRWRRWHGRRCRVLGLREGDGRIPPTPRLTGVNGGAKRDHRGGVRRDHLAAAGLSPSPWEGPGCDAACPQQADAAARAGGTCGPTGSSVGWVVGSVRRRGLTPAALVEPVALAIHLEDVDVVGEAVEESAGKPLGAEHLGPFVERQIGGDQGRAPLVAPG